jgi:YD repeat-containing protein
MNRFFVELAQRTEVQVIGSRAMACSLALGTYLFTSVPALAGTDSYIYDSLGRVVAVIRASGTTTSYSYDAAGNRRAVTTVNNSPVTWGNFNWKNATWHN